jgi:hypothetical protein
MDPAELWVEPPPISFCQILFDRIAAALARARKSPKAG